MIWGRWEKSLAWTINNICECGDERCWDWGGFGAEAALQRGDGTSRLQLCCEDELGCLTSVQGCSAFLNRRKVIEIN